MINDVRKLTQVIPAPAKSSYQSGSNTPAPQNTPPLAAPETPTAPPPPAAPALSVNLNARLVIEKDALTGSFIYKSVDRITGKVIQQFPREEVLRAMAAAKAAEGLIVDTKA